MIAELYRLFFEEAQDALVAVDLKSGKIVAFNRTFEALSGFSRDEILGEPIRLVSGDLGADYARDRKFNLETLSIAGLYNDLVLATKERDVRFVSAKVKHVDVENRALALAVLSDDTERQFLIRDLAVKHQSLEQAFADLEKVHMELKASQERMAQSSKLAALGELAAGLSHELGQPLTGVKGFAQEALDILKTEPKPSKKRMRELIADVVLNADKMAGLLAHFRSFARQEKRSFDKNDKLEGVNLKRVFESVTKLMNRQFENHGIEVRSNFNAGALAAAQAHPVEQIIINLLSNSRDALAEKTKSSKNFTPRIEVSLAIEKEFLCFRVADNGPGIPESHQLKIFDPFFTTKEPGKGMGLGLSISYGIAHRFGGEVLLEKSDSSGTVFVLKLPLYHSSALRAA